MIVFKHSAVRKCEILHFQGPSESDLSSECSVCVSDSWYSAVQMEDKAGSAGLMACMMKLSCSQDRMSTVWLTSQG